MLGRFLRNTGPGAQFPAGRQTRLAAWSQLTTIHNVTGPTRLLDPNAAGSTRFYRALRE